MSECPNCCPCCQEADSAKRDLRSTIRERDEAREALALAGQEAARLERERDEALAAMPHEQVDIALHCAALQRERDAARELVRKLMTSDRLHILKHADKKLHEWGMGG